ncbi:MAG: branched-chain alpha-keto acid dehydrogenase subunit E2 [Arenimonas sp. SCN 70-307]|uniref:dihydrolipoamide acetyltransferase family protein n=1 Tax=Arenimonas sp. SCN 70-307 TaxID=1660089 RepID=UPI00086B7B4C|nr:dihydrolipoamide acetyltransferase family protein [Arenimonas sp. SCN 70-307]ODS64116.1 MAG: branched-chain alpha-keto acid dehydrogenase subunit E2 [Arenimonas sp. SCN 70-307]
MSEKKLFLLPDLGEGLPDAEIVEWLVKVGDVVKLDEPLVSMETAKAVVEVPSPYSGKVTRLAGGAGDVIETGSWLVEVEIDPSLPQRAEAQDTGHSHGHKKAEAPPAPAPAPADSAAEKPADAGTVVGAMQTSDAVRSEQAVAVGGVKAMPAVRALAKKLKVDLARVRPTGADGVVTMADVKQAAAAGTAPLGAAPARTTSLPLPPAGEGRGEGPRAPSAAPPSQPSPASGGKSTAPAFDIDEPIRGVRRNMVRSMSQAHAEVVPTTLMDDADIHAWAPGEDIMARIIRAIAVASAVEPAMNAWLNAKEGTLRRHARVDVGIAVDSPDGLFVANLRNAERLEPHQVRQAINRIRDGVKNRSLPPEELRDYTIMLSNFGVFAGKYATPVVVPPCVAIIGAGRLHHAVVPVLGGLETHRIMPISLTFDHRAATGGEAARFLRALLDDLQRAR